MTKVLVISDTHIPFQDKAALRKVVLLTRQERPTHIVQIGDLLDQYVFSRYSRTHNLLTPEDEIKKALSQAGQLWKALQKAAPKAKCIQLLGNHDVRVQKRVMERLPELQSLFSLKKLYTFPKVHTLKSDRDFKVIDGVVYTHGWLSKSLDHAKHFNKPTVHGHRHKPAIETQGQLWSMDVGFLGDERQLPFGYTMSKLTNWRMAVGIVENAKPRLILL